MLYNRCMGIYKFENNTYPRRIRHRSNVGHIFREKKCILWAGKYSKIFPSTCHGGMQKDWRYSSTHFNLCTWGEWSSTRPGHFLSLEEITPSIHETEPVSTFLKRKISFPTRIQNLDCTSHSLVWLRYVCSYIFSCKRQNGTL